MLTTETGWLDKLVRVEGGTMQAVVSDKTALAGGEAGLYVARPQTLFRPDVALVYGPKGARARVVAVRLGGEPYPLGAREAIEPAPHRAIAAAKLLHIERRASEPSSFVEMLVSNDAERGSPPVELAPIFLGLAVDGRTPCRSAMGALRAVDDAQPQRYSVDAAPNPNKIAPAPVDAIHAPRQTVLTVETIFRHETAVRGLCIESDDAEPGDLWVVDWKVGKDSQFTTPAAWPVELFASPLPVDSETVPVGVVVTLKIGNRSNKRRHWRFAWYVEPPKDERPTVDGAALEAL